MENGQADEETQPLAPPPQRRVAEAYASNTGGNALKKYGFYIFIVVAFLVLGGDNNKHRRAKRLRKKPKSTSALTAPEQEINNEISHKNDQVLTNAFNNVASSKDSLAANTDDEAEAEEELEGEIVQALEEVDQAEEEEIEINDSMLVAAMRSVEDNVKFYLGRVFGSDAGYDDEVSVTSGDTSDDVKLSEAQLDNIAKKISERLEKEVRKEFRTKADVITGGKVEEIDQVVAEDRDTDMGAHEIADDVAEAEKMVVEDLKDEIDEAAEKVIESIPVKAEKIRNDVVEEMTGKKLDNIENSKRRKKQRHKDMVKKFKEMQAKITLQNADERNIEDNEAMKHGRGSSNAEKPGFRETKRNSTDE